VGSRTLLQQNPPVLNWGVPANILTCAGGVKWFLLLAAKRLAVFTIQCLSTKIKPMNSINKKKLMTQNLFHCNSMHISAATKQFWLDDLRGTSNNTGCAQMFSHKLTISTITNQKKKLL